MVYKDSETLKAYKASEGYKGHKELKAILKHSAPHLQLLIWTTKITNLSTDAAGVISATNVRYVKCANENLILTLSDRFSKKISK